MHLQRQLQTTHRTNTAIINKNLKQIKQTGFLIKALRSSIRQKIISHLLLEKNEAVHVMCKELEIDQTCMSQHLSILRKANLVQSKRAGKEIFYSINREHLNRAVEFIKQITEGALYGSKEN